MQDERPYHAGGRLGQPSDVVALRRALVAAGFTPLPLFGKAPPSYGKNGAKKGLGGWQHLEDVSAEQIDDWSRHWPDAINTGILTAYTPPLDLDILNEEAARACEDLVRAQFEERGFVLVRIGLPPKRAILFRTETPFKEILFPSSRPTATEKSEKIEFLGNGQQLACFGIHPDTEQPYRWHGGEPGQVRRDDLPLITAAEAEALVEDLVGLLIKDFGYNRRRSASTPAELRPQPRHHRLGRPLQQYQHGPGAARQPARSRRQAGQGGHPPRRHRQPVAGADGGVHRAAG